MVDFEALHHTHLKLLDTDLGISDSSGLQEHEQLHRSPSGKKTGELNEENVHST